jgi:protein subunit release factor B
MISENKWIALRERMQTLGIADSDLEERFVLGSGAGGQKVNKTASCVQLSHSESGIEVRSQRSRSQADNRYFARAELCGQITERRTGEKSRKQQEREKIRRQKRRRSRRSKNRMLDDKSKQGEKKSLRKSPKDY